MFRITLSPFFSLFLKNLKEDILLVYKFFNVVIVSIFAIVYWVLEFPSIKSFLKFSLRILAIFCIGYYFTALPLWLVITLVVLCEFLPAGLLTFTFLIGFIAMFTI